MVELRPYPFSSLVARALREHCEKQAIFDLPAKKFFRGDRERDLSVRFHGLEASTPLGPAAGPQSQMAQNIALAWLGGARILELKTVQVKDELKIPRPCIDAQTVGYNVEWSQELKLQQSLEEYVKGSMLVDVLAQAGELELAPGAERTIFDMSVGYDLAGIQSATVQAFLRGMRDATPVVERLRRELPADLARLRDLDYRSRLSDTLTLSTFHGCPPDEIERIMAWLLEEHRLNCIVKLNPTLLGKQELRRLLHDELGYTELNVPDTAFERDTRWEQALEIVGRLRALAQSLGLGFGIKLTNTLIVENHRSFFPASEREMYLSGQPLHVLAMHLVRRFRREFGGSLPISFSAGIDRKNFADAAAIGLVPITVCTDLLRPGGYGRASGYLEELGSRMEACGAATVPEFVLRSGGHATAALEALRPPAEQRAACERALSEGTGLERAAGADLFARWVQEAAVRNTEAYVEAATRDARYHADQNRKPPRKIGSKLVLFDCITCDKCVPVCPNDANFTLAMPAIDVPILKLRKAAGGWLSRETGRLVMKEKHQIATFHDFCNECGNCDVFCPEDGGPYAMKPRFFGTEHDWREAAPRDGFCVERVIGAERVHGRFGGADYLLEVRDGRAAYSGPGFALRFEVQDPVRTAAGDASDEADLGYFEIMNRLRTAVLAEDAVNYVNALHSSKP